MSTFISILLAFFGGVLATCLGALGSVILCAFLVLIGVCAVMAGCDYNIVMNIGFSFFWSPALGLAPAACALGYAKKRGYVEDGKGIALPLMHLGKVDVLVVGGLFGILAYAVMTGLNLVLAGKLDNVSATVVIVGLVASVLFGGKGVFGQVPEGDKRFGVYSKNNWMPHMPYGEGVTYWFFAGGAGLLSAWLFWEISEFAKSVNSDLIASVAMFPVFALAVINLILLCAGLPCPVFHHVGLTAVYGCMMAYGAGASEIVVFLWGMACGIISHFAADLLADIFSVYNDTYVDPPSLSMTFCSVFTWIIFPALGLYTGTAAVVTPIILLIATFIFSVVVQVKRRAAMKAEAEAAA